MDKSWLHADLGVEVGISCIVYAEPAAEVRYFQFTSATGTECPKVSAHRGMARKMKIASKGIRKLRSENWYVPQVTGGRRVSIPKASR